MVPPSEFATQSTRRPVTHTASAKSRTGLFPLTQWSIISQARALDDERVAEGLRQLALGYWRPLYLYLRKRGESHEDASDSVQGFFEFVFSSGFFSHVEREGGKFRSYLLKSLERWRSRRRVYDRAQKRGGHVAHVSLEGIEEIQELADHSEGDSPEVAFDRQWAMDIVGRAVVALREDYQRRGREDWFLALRGVLPGSGEAAPPYIEVAAGLGATEGAVKKAAFDLRNAFATRLREEIRATVCSNEDAEEELRYLVSVMMGQGENSDGA